jgi:hypothetical protein
MVDHLQGKTLFFNLRFLSISCVSYWNLPANKRSDRQREVDGVGGAAASGAEEGVEVKWECVLA